MKDHELFGVVVRTIGLLMFMYGVMMFAFAILAVYDSPSQGFAALCAVAIVALAAGFALLLRPDYIVKAAYRNLQ